MAIDKAANADTVKNCSVEIIKNTCKPEISNVIHKWISLFEILDLSPGTKSFEAIEARVQRSRPREVPSPVRSKDE